MDITISGNEFIEVKGITHIISSKASLENYKDEKTELKGDFFIELEYFTNKEEREVLDERTILFTVIKDENKIIEGVTMDKYDFSVIDNQGLRMEYTLTIHATEVLMVEEIKDEIIKETSDKLDVMLNDRNEALNDENPPIEKEVIEAKVAEFVPKRYIVDDDYKLKDLEETYTSYKVVFLNKDDELEEVLCKYKKNLTDIYEENNFEIKDHLIFEVKDE